MNVQACVFDTCRFSQRSNTWIVELVMGLLCFSNARASLSTAKEVPLEECVRLPQCLLRNRELRVENILPSLEQNKKFKADFEGGQLGESTICLLKKILYRQNP